MKRYFQLIEMELEYILEGKPVPQWLKDELAKFDELWSKEVEEDLPF